MGYNLNTALKKIHSFTGNYVYEYTLTRNNGEVDGGTISCSRGLDTKTDSRRDYHTEILTSIDYPVPEYPGRESTFSNVVEAFDASHNFIARVDDELITYSSQITYELPAIIHLGEQHQLFWAATTIPDGSQIGGIQVDVALEQIDGENFLLYIEKEFDKESQLISTAIDYYPIDRAKMNVPIKVTIEYVDKDFFEMKLLKVH
jgi:hypothetical protein